VEQLLLFPRALSGAGRAKKAGMAPPRLHRPDNHIPAHPLPVSSLVRPPAEALHLLNRHLSAVHRRR
jgi:hypothetical protein